MALMAKRLKDFRNGELPINPYNFDHMRMGMTIDETWEIMFDRHDNNEFIIVVDKQTGERFLITRVGPNPQTWTSLDNPL